MIIVDKPISSAALRELAAGRFGNMVKGVVDVKKRILALDAELHADEEAELLAGGSQQADLWGINLYPDLPGDEMLEFDSMINVRPSQGNRSRTVEGAALREQIAAIMKELILA
jgi:hypothetical protein